MEIIDIVLAIPLIYGMYRGFRKGLIMEVVNLLALILALIGGFKLMDQCLVILIDFFGGKPHPLFPFLAFVLVFAGIVIGVNLLGKMLKGLIGMTILGSLDKLIGAFIGLIKWSFGLSLLLWLVDMFVPEIFDEQTRENAVLFPILLTFASHVFHILTGLLPFLSDMMDSIKELLQSNASHY